VFRLSILYFLVQLVRLKHRHVLLHGCIQKSPYMPELKVRMLKGVRLYSFHCYSVVLKVFIFHNTSFDVFMNSCLYLPITNKMSELFLL